MLCEDYLVSLQATDVTASLYVLRICILCLRLSEFNALVKSFKVFDSRIGQTKNGASL